MSRHGQQTDQTHIGDVGSPMVYASGRVSPLSPVGRRTLDRRGTPVRRFGSARPPGVGVDLLGVGYLGRRCCGVNGRGCPSGPAPPGSPRPPGERGAIRAFQQVHALRRKRVAHQHAGEVVGTVGGQRLTGCHNQPKVSGPFPTDRCLCCSPLDRVVGPDSSSA